MKVETFTVLDDKEFEKLCRDHLEVTLEFDAKWDDPARVGAYCLIADVEGCQNTYIIFRPEDADNYIEEFEKGWVSKTYSYAGQLFKKGVFTQEHPVFLQMWW